MFNIFLLVTLERVVVVEESKYLGTTIGDIFNFKKVTHGIMLRRSTRGFIFVEEIKAFNIPTDFLFLLLALPFSLLLLFKS